MGMHACRTAEYQRPLNRVGGLGIRTKKIRGVRAMTTDSQKLLSNTSEPLLRGGGKFITGGSRPLKWRGEIRHVDAKR